MRIARKKASDWMRPAALPLACGWANGLSPGRTAGYGKRAEMTLDSPRPANRMHALTPTRDGSTATLPYQAAQSGAPMRMSGTPSIRDGTRRPNRSAHPPVFDATWSQIAVLSWAMSLWDDQDRKRHITGSGSRASACSGTPATASTITKITGAAGMATRAVWYRASRIQ